MRIKEPFVEKLKVTGDKRVGIFYWVSRPQMQIGLDGREKRREFQFPMRVD